MPSVEELEDCALAIGSSAKPTATAVGSAAMVRPLRAADGERRPDALADRRG